MPAPPKGNVTTYGTDMTISLGGYSRANLALLPGLTPSEIGEAVFSILEDRNPKNYLGKYTVKFFEWPPDYMSTSARIALEEKIERLEKENATLRSELTKKDGEVVSLKEANFNLFDTTIRLSVVAEHLVKEANK